MPNYLSDINLETVVCDFRGYLSADREDARRHHELAGGYLFRLGEIYLVCDRGDALGWGWTEEELRLLPCRPVRRAS